MCSKPGHNHEWKHCPDNLFRKKETNNETSMRCEEVSKEKEKDNDEDTPINNNFSTGKYW